MTPRLLLPAAGLLAFAAPAAAQQAMAAHVQAAAAGTGIGAAAIGPATRIQPDTAPSRSLGTIVTRTGRIFRIDGGTRAGANLFHSFAHFDLGAGDIARWTYSAGDPAAIRNVVSRVTDGQPSSIFGTIDSSALPNADFWFVNPAGILFGEGARIDVPGVAHFSTAQELRFDSGPAFAVTTPGGSTFSVAAPAAFGFLGGQGAIVVDWSTGASCPKARACPSLPAMSR